jgi:signal transduction histidine kinase
MSSYLTSVKSYATDQRKLGDLATLDKEKSLLFANVSHELITPISLIAGPLDDIIAETDGARRQHLTIARRNVYAQCSSLVLILRTKLSRLVTMLMEISNLEAGRLKGSFAPTNLGVLTRNVASQFSKSAAKAGLEYTISCDREARDTYIDTEQWEKIMFILIGRSCD